jgi:hypothetical protein
MTDDTQDTTNGNSGALSRLGGWQVFVIGLVIVIGGGHPFVACFAQDRFHRPDRVGAVAFGVSRDPQSILHDILLINEKWWFVVAA